MERLLHTGRVEVSQFIDLFTAGPARVLRRDDIGSLRIGAAGDLTLLDLDRQWAFESDGSQSKSKNTPFLERRFRGGACATVVGGRVVWDAESGVRV
jgi:dihydroorotase